jgi:hypothetical protein
MEENTAEPKQEQATEPIVIRGLDRVETTVVASNGSSGN